MPEISDADTIAILDRLVCRLLRRRPPIDVALLISDALREAAREVRMNGLPAAISERCIYLAELAVSRGG